MITQETLYKQANKWEPEASRSPQSFRMAKCARCGKRLWFRMFHCWLDNGGFKKELHFDKKCYKILSS